MKKILLVTVWFITAMLVLDMMCFLLTYPATIANIVGILGLMSFVYFSYVTRCFTKNKFKLSKK